MSTASLDAVAYDTAANPLLDDASQGADADLTVEADGAEPADITPVKRAPKRKSTSHLKLVPPTLELRERIKQAAADFVAGVDKSRPFSRAELEAGGRRLLERMGQPDSYLGFSMVMLGNFFWKEQFLSTPFEKRLLLLPHCLKHAEGCPADYDELGLQCETCGACSIADYKGKAEALGYKVLVAEGTPVVLKLIVSGYVHSILGVACLNVLEKAIDKILIAGVPAYAIPLHSGDCKNTTLDASWVWEVIDQYQPARGQTTRSYVPMMRAASQLFDGEHFDRLVPPRATATAGQPAFGPIAETDRIARDFLARGGKRSRPFVTLSVLNALRPNSPAHAFDQLVDSLSDGARRVALAMEAFHKASLVHDDIEDNDEYRYGEPALHRQHDVATAINVGDYLIGMGYKLLLDARQEIGAEVSADISARLADAHLRLCDGQGAELAWRRAADKTLTPLDAMRIYALKTSPAFEASLYAGLRLAGPAEEHEKWMPPFCRHLGVGFQILNDLKDWRGDDGNKVITGQDAASMRPTLLLAMALEAAQKRGDQQILAELRAMLANAHEHGLSASQVRRQREIFQHYGVFDLAEKLIDKSRARAEALADEVASDELRQLLYFLVDTVLAPEAEPTPLEQLQAAQQQEHALPIVRMG